MVIPLLSSFIVFIHPSLVSILRFGHGEDAQDGPPRAAEATRFWNFCSRSLLLNLRSWSLSFEALRRWNHPFEACGCWNLNFSGNPRSSGITQRLLCLRIRYLRQRSCFVNVCLHPGDTRTWGTTNNISQSLIHRLWPVVKSSCLQKYPQTPK